MRVTLFPIDVAGCGRYRLIYPALEAHRAGDIDAQVSVHDRGERKYALAQIPRDVDADVVVLQRPCGRVTLDAIEHLQRNGVAVVVELDDDLSAIHAHHPSFEDLHPGLNSEVNWNHLKTACRLADLVTVTTPALAARYGDAKARVLPNYVPAQLLDLGPQIAGERDGRTIGWGGTTWTHVRDLTATRGGVAEALRDTGASFRVVGPPDGVRAELGLLSEPDYTGSLEFAGYHARLAELDVGIAPLLDSAFNAAKSGLKLLEYAALGIAAVCSPREDYRRLHAEGIGLLAKDRARDWRRQLRQLLTDEAFRLETAEQARAAVAERHTIESNAWRWCEAWEEAVQIRRAKGKAIAA